MTSTTSPWHPLTASTAEFTSMGTKGPIGCVNMMIMWGLGPHPWK